MITRSFFSGVLFLAGLAGLSACNPQNFSAPTENPAAPAATTTTVPNTCTATNVEAMVRKTKILFVVDTSGSNAATTSYQATSTCNQNGQCLVPASDPQKSFRGGAISDFLARYRHKTNFQWSFETFAEASAHSLVNNGSDQSPVFSTDPNVMQLGLNSFYATRDYGQTPYRPAFDLAAKAIQNDPDRNSSDKPNYFVILLTDGYPTDYYDQSGGYAGATMNNDISALLATAPGQVSLSTIYYGQGNDPSAIGLLHSIAVMGGGQFASVLDANSGFKIDDVIPGSTTGCP